MKEASLTATIFNRSLTILVIGLAILCVMIATSKTAYAQEEQADTAEATALENYSYTVQPGDGVTHLIMDLAEANGTAVTPEQAYQIAQNNGQAFLDQGITVASTAPFTEGIGGLPSPGTVISVDQHQDLFSTLNSNLEEVATQNTEAAANEEAASSETGGNSALADVASSSTGWIWGFLIAGAAGTLYYLLSRRDATEIK